MSSEVFNWCSTVLICSDVPVVSLTLERSQVSIHWLPIIWFPILQCININIIYTLYIYIYISSIYSLQFGSQHFLRDSWVKTHLFTDHLRRIIHHGTMVAASHSNVMTTKSCHFGRLVAAMHCWSWSKIGKEWADKADKAFPRLFQASQVGKMDSERIKLKIPTSPTGPTTRNSFQEVWFRMMERSAACLKACEAFGKSERHWRQNWAPDSFKSC